MFCDGLVVTLLPLLAFSDVAGDQVYVAAPLAVNVVEEPLQTDALKGVIETFGGLLTVTTTVPDAVHALATVPVTVYDVVMVGDAVTEAPFVTSSPVDGDHV
jgi:hypothetical protein